MRAWQSNEPDACFGADARDGFARADEAYRAPLSEENRKSIAGALRA